MRDPDAVQTPFEYDENPWDGWNVTANGNNGSGGKYPGTVNIAQTNTLQGVYYVESGAIESNLGVSLDNVTVNDAGTLGINIAQNLRGSAWICQIHTSLRTSERT